MTEHAFYGDIFGHRMFVDESDQGMRIGSLNGMRLWRWRRLGGEIGFIFRTVRTGQTALDVGANVGLITLPLARQVGPRGRVIAFEPGPRSFQLLTKNVAANGYDHVRMENAAVSDRSGFVNLFVCSSGESDNRIEGTLVDVGEREKVRVPCFSIDDYIERHKVQSVDFIKLDVQGAEMFALHGMRDTLRKNHGVQLILEFSPEAIKFGGSSAEEMLDLLHELRFNLYRLADNDRERLTTKQWLLENVGQSNKVPHLNVLLRR